MGKVSNLFLVGYLLGSMALSSYIGKRVSDNLYENLISDYRFKEGELENSLGTNNVTVPNKIASITIGSLYGFATYAVLAGIPILIFLGARNTQISGPVSKPYNWFTH